MSRIGDRDHTWVERAFLAIQRHQLLPSLSTADDQRMVTDFIVIIRMHRLA